MPESTSQAPSRCKYRGQGNKYEQEAEIPGEHEPRKDRVISALYQAVVKGESTDDGLVAFAPFFEFLNVQAAILILVHHVEDLLYAFFGRIFVFGELDH